MCGIKKRHLHQHPGPRQGLGPKIVNKSGPGPGLGPGLGPGPGPGPGPGLGPGLGPGPGPGPGLGPGPKILINRVRVQKNLINRVRVQKRWTRRALTPTPYQFQSIVFV